MSTTYKWHIVNPGTGEVLGELATAGPHEVDARLAFLETFEFVAPFWVKFERQEQGRISA